MSRGLEIAVRIVVIGASATLLLDLWNAALKRFLGINSLSFAMLGRWFGHFAHLRFRHESIAAAALIPGERLIGWIAHYAIGMTWAGVLIAIRGLDWARHPTLLSALMVGVGTVTAPFFIMQPAMGGGILASKTPRPNLARVKSIVSHTVYGIGLYAAAWLTASSPPH